MSFVPGRFNLNRANLIASRQPCRIRELIPPKSEEFVSWNFFLAIIFLSLIK